MKDCNPTELVKGFEDIVGGECTQLHKCTVARAYLRSEEPELAKLLGEFPCGKQAELVYINGESALVDQNHDVRESGAQ